MLQLRIPSAFPSSGEGSGGGVRPLSRHHVGNRACVAARPGKKTPPANPSCYGGLAGVSQVVDGNAGPVSSFPARTTVARHDRFCLQVLAWLVRPCGVRLARRVSQVLQVVDGNAGTVSGFPARTTVARREAGSACGFWRGCCVRAGSVLARRVSSSLVHAAPWLAGPREAEGASGPAEAS